MAKRRRIDLKFVVISALVLVVLAGAAYALRRTVFRPDPAKYVASAKVLMERGEWDAAITDIGKAIRYSRGPDPTTWIMLAEALNHKTGDDFGEFSKQWYGALNQALTIDPNNKAALRMTLEYQMDRVQEAGLRGAGEFDAITRYSDRLLAVDPNDKRAQYISGWAVLEKKLSNIQVNDTKLLQQSEQKIKDLLKADPKDSESAFLLARWRISQLWEEQRQGNLKDAKQHFADLEKFVDDNLAAAKDDPVMHQRMAQVLMAMADTYVQIQDKSATDQSLPTPEFKNLPPERQAIYRKRLEYWHRGFAEMETANNLVKPDNVEDFVGLRTFYAKQMERPFGLMKVDAPREEMQKQLADSQKKAEASYREVITKYPAERRVKMQLAKFIARDPERRAEAIKLLEEPSPKNPRWIGVKGFWVRSSEVETLVTLCDIKLDLAETKPDQEKQVLLKQVQADYDKLVALVGENAGPALTVKGRKEMMQGEWVAAQQTLERALQPGVFQGSGEDRSDLDYQLARTFMATNQTGEAKKRLRDVIEITPSHILARMQLADLLIREGNIKGTPPRFEDGAIAQLEAIERVVPADNVAIVRLRLLTIDRAKEPDKFKAQWARIGEATVPEKFDKARLAASIDLKDEAVRLLEAIRAEKPGSLTVAQLLVQMYSDRGQKEKALAVLDEAIAKNPQEAGLKSIRAVLIDPAQAQANRKEFIDSIADPLKKALALVEYYRDTGEQDKVVEQLQAAEKLAPDNGRIMSALFDTAVDRKEWDKAKSYLDKLAKRNEDGTNGQIYRVRLALAQGKLDEAVDQASKLTKTHEKFAQAWVYYGQALQTQSKFEEAIKAYQSALDRQTENVPALRGLIECSYALKQPGKPSNPQTGEKASGARGYIEVGQRIFPFSNYFKELGLRWEMAYGDPEKAIAPRAQALKDHPENPGTWMDLAVAYLAAAEPRATVASNTAPKQGEAAPASPLNDPKFEAQRTTYLGKARDCLAMAWQKFPKETRFVGPLVDCHIQLKETDKAEKVMSELLSRPEYKGTPDAALAYSDFYTRANQPEKAEGILRESFKSAPTNIAVQMRLAGLLSQANKVEDAVQVLSTNTDNDLIARQRVDVLVNAGRVEDASKFVDTLLAAKPTYVFYSRLRANVDLAMGKVDEVRNAANQILAANPDDIDGLYLRARANMADSRADINSIIDDLNRVVVLQPSASEARIQLSDAYWRGGKIDDAIRTLKDTLQYLPSNKTLRLRLLNLYATANPPKWFEAETLLKESRQQPQFATDVNFVHAEALMWYQRKEPNKALALIKDVIAKEPKNIAFQQTYLAILSDQKDYATLMTEAQKVITAHPEVWWAYQARAVARNKAQGDRKGALADFQTAMTNALKAQDQQGFETAAKAIAAELGQAEAKNALLAIQGLDAHWQLVVAALLQQVGAIPEATAMVEKVMADPKLAPVDLVNALRIGGGMYMTSNPPNRAKAIDFHRRLVKEVPNDYAALNNLAYLLLEDGPTRNPTEAVTYSERVLELTRRQNATEALPLVMDTHAWALINSGKPDEGISLLREALAKKEFAEGFYHLGIGYTKQQRPALLEAERALMDAKHKQEDDVRIGIKADPDLKSRIDALDSIKLMKK